MTKIPVKTRVPVQVWTLAVLITLFSLISSAIEATTQTGTPSAVHAKLVPDADPMTTSAIR